ncbi:AMP-binding protein [bacterium]|nr:AMP-binding protein [candidate division CSSED10-310 bacterium]
MEQFQIHSDYRDIPIPLDRQLDYQAQRIGGKTAIIYKDRRIRYIDLKRMVDNLAFELHRRGIKPGDRVFIAMQRRPELIAAFLAVARVGALAVPLNFKASDTEIAGMRFLIKPAATLFHTDLENQIGRSDPGEWILAVSMDMLSTDTSGENAVAAASEPDDPVYLNFTSGSTGQVKAAVASHRNLFYNTMASALALNIDSTDIHLPLFAVMLHPHEIFCRALMLGGTVVLIEQLYPRSIARAIHEHRVTCVMAVSPVYELLLPFGQCETFDFSSLRIPESGGMATPQWLQERFQAEMGAAIVPVWGSTETMGIAFASKSGGNTPPGSVGQVIPYYETKLTDAAGEPVPDGEVGELWIRSPGIMLSYWRADEETARVMKDGWLCTGDLFRRDAHGNYTCVGRTDAMIKVGGIKVYPAEIEAVLFSHPLVRDAVVIPYEDRLRGVVPMAAVVIEPGETLTEPQLRQYLGSKLSRARQPRIIRFMSDLPRTSGGKVDRKILTGTSLSDKSDLAASMQRRIESIDLKILHLLNERFKVVMDLHRRTNEKTFHPEQIQETLQRLLEFNPGPLHDSIIEEIFHAILSIEQYL